MKHFLATAITAWILTIASVAHGDTFSRFMPQPENSSQLDYEVWDDILEGIVVYTGPSLRIRARKPDRGINKGKSHNSPYRLEGNKIAFSKIEAGWQTAIRQYSYDLENIANEDDISKFPKQEQLAFWFNLHNSRIISLIADNYPITIPSKIRLKIIIYWMRLKYLRLRGCV